MRSKKVNNQFVLRIDHGEDVIQTLKRFCKEKAIKAATFTCFGGILDPVLSFFDKDMKMEETQKFVGDFTIASMQGNIALYDDELAIHAFTVLNDYKFQTIGGQLLEAQSRVAVEVFLQPIDGELIRDTDRKYHSALLDL